MKLTILGCQSPFPGPGGATAGYLLETRQGKILLDCGSGVISQLQRVTDLKQVDAILLSHLHEDHIADIGVLKYAFMIFRKLGMRDRLLPVYIPEETPPDLLERIHYEPAFEVNKLSVNEPLEIIGLNITFLKTDHNLPCYAMKFTDGEKVLVYGADAGIHTPYPSFIQGVDLFICEGTYQEGLSAERAPGHLSNIEAARIAQEAGCKQLILTHLWPDFDLMEYEKEAKPHYQGKLSIARIGDSYEL